MKIWGISVEEIETIVREVSTLLYDGNIIFKRAPECNGRATSFTLTVKDSKERGSRRSADGRRIAAACWHANKDVITAVFKTNPNARIKSAVADYKGIQDFVTKFPQTGDQNMGSAANPLAYRDACNCEEFGA